MSLSFPKLGSISLYITSVTILDSRTDQLANQYSRQWRNEGVGFKVIGSSPHIAVMEVSTTGTTII